MPGPKPLKETCKNEIAREAMEKLGMKTLGDLLRKMELDPSERPSVYNVLNVINPPRGKNGRFRKISKRISRALGVPAKKLFDTPPYLQRFGRK